MRQFAMNLGTDGADSRAIKSGSLSGPPGRKAWTRAMAVLAVVGLAPVAALTLPSTPTASAASPPVARADVARTDSGQLVSIFTNGNDFDPDGDSFFVSSIITPPHGTIDGAGFSTGFSYTPNPGFSGVETITYRIRDNHGLISTGVVTVFVDSGVTGPQTPVLLVDYLYVYQGSSVAVTTSELLGNDHDPQNQTLTVVSVSEPSSNGVLTGDVATGFSYPPGNSPTLANTDDTLDYLAIDTDGHVAQSNIIIRILANGDPNQPPVAVPDAATSSGQLVSIFTNGNDFDPDGDSFF